MILAKVESVEALVLVVLGVGLVQAVQAGVWVMAVQVEVWAMGLELE